MELDTKITFIVIGAILLISMRNLYCTYLVSNKKKRERFKNVKIIRDYFSKKKKSGREVKK